MYAIIDVETTGGRPQYERIIEIAIYITDGYQILSQFSSLINPERAIPSNITMLTGITNEMVNNAPKFYEVAKEIVLLLEGKTFVAHNVNFDYGFVRHEFQQLGFNFHAPRLDTVRMARKSIPGHSSYSLGKLCRAIGIELNGRHRAAGDALATTHLFHLIMKNESGILDQFLQNDIVKALLPTHIDRKVLDALPEACGLYYFYNHEGLLIYVGKSNNIRQRVITHLSNKKSKKALQMASEITNILFEVTGNELIALLKESHIIKDKSPRYNRAERLKSLQYGIYKSYSPDGFIKLYAGQLKKGADPVIWCNNLAEAKSVLERRIDKYRLCLKFTGDDQIKFACFRRKIGLCDGACVGDESVTEYNEKVMRAIDHLGFEKNNFLIKLKGRAIHEQAFVMIENKDVIGYGYVDENNSILNPKELLSLLQPLPLHQDFQRIVRKYLLAKGEKNILPYTLSKELD